MKQHSQKGNVLFLILIAVALFAALGFAVTQTLRNSPKDSQRDSQRIRAAELTQYPTFIGEAVMRLKFRGIEDTDLCFDSPLWGNNDYYHAGCDDDKHKVFLAHGGEVAWTPPAEGANSGENWYITGQSCVIGVGKSQDVDCNGDSSGDSEEIIMFLPNISRALCLEINEKLGIANPGGNPPKASGDLWPAGMPVFAGNFTDGGRIDSLGSGDADILAGHSFGCVEGGGTPPAGTYAYFHVLVRR